MVYVDKPKPSKGYISYFIYAALLLPAFFLTLIIFWRPVASIIFFREQDSSLLFIMFLIGYIPVVFLIGIAIHAGYNTEYWIENGKLWMKFGYVRKESVLLDEIKGVEKVESFRVRRRGFKTKAYCNRYKNGVLIITEKRIILVSPEDSERFISELGLQHRR